MRRRHRQMRSAEDSTLLRIMLACCPLCWPSTHGTFFYLHADNGTNSIFDHCHGGRQAHMLITCEPKYYRIRADIVGPMTWTVFEGEERADDNKKKPSTAIVKSTAVVTADNMFYLAEVFGCRDFWYRKSAQFKIQEPKGRNFCPGHRFTIFRSPDMLLRGFTAS